MYENNEGEFIITCQVCKSNNCEVQEDVDYDCEENPYTSGFYLECLDCGNNDRFK